MIHSAIADRIPPILAEDEDPLVRRRASAGGRWRPSADTLPALLAAGLLLLTPLLALTALSITNLVEDGRVAALEQQVQPLIQTEQWLRHRAASVHAAQSLTVSDLCSIHQRASSKRAAWVARSGTMRWQAASCCRRTNSISPEAAHLRRQKAAESRARKEAAREAVES